MTDIYALTYDQLWFLFESGFDASSEGFNGEYANERYHGLDGQARFKERLKPDFERALTQMGMA